MSREAGTGERTDFATYVYARWPDMVGGLEDEGVAADEARLAVAEALLGRRSSWPRRSRDEDVDVTLWAEIRERAALPPTGQPAPHGVRPYDPHDGPEDWFARAEARRGARRRRGAVRVAVGVLVLAVLAAGWQWWASIPPAPEVRKEANSLPVVWYAAGELHLEDVVVELPGIDTFVADGSGAAAVLRNGETVRIDEDGDVTTIDDPPDALDEEPDPPRFVAITQYDVVLQAAPVAGGGWAYLLDSSRRDGATDAVRRSESGRRALVVCRAELDCAPAVTVVAADGAIRLR
ncbi:hypothetical protein EUA06_18225 [Nocardioides glacieisoli]|uniref:Uncharacterized protein n=1 Tax=Nocardioides glacieisoli TaxID=1168730 RepID=A0A4Q2RN39_9ACTN|nr:hypothetical protein [Nocardioides glacieisoli]RYB89039.1 hypothetical protein EUA06_18225 [Nocardioides glacieisoli]